MPPVVQPGGNMFLPIPDPSTTDQQPAQGTLGQQVDPSRQPMQPPQSPEEHAQNKAGWLDWLRSPSTSAFLMQFGASMLQPNQRGFGAQLGQSLGEGGQAVARVGEQARQQMESEAKARESEAQAGYYEAETAARPTLTAAQLERAQAAQEIATSKMDTASQLMWFKQRLDEAIGAKDYANAQLYQAQIQKLQDQLTNPGRAMYEKEHEAWVAGGQLGPEPKPTDPAYQFGPATTTGTAPTAKGPDLAKTAPVPADSPDFVSTVRNMTAEERNAYTQIYYGRGGEQWKTWQTVLDRLREPGAGQPPITGRSQVPGPPPVVRSTLGPAFAPPPAQGPANDPNAPLAQKIIRSMQQPGGGL